MSPPQGVLVDLDGTLVDTEPLWSRAAGELAREHGARWEDADGGLLVGMLIPDIAELLRERGVSWPRAQVEGWLTGRVGDLMGADPPWRPGALDLLTALAGAGLPSALVTMTYRTLAVAVASAAPAGSLTVVVAGDEVRRGKPAPEAYLLAAARLGVDARTCVAVEDSVPGITAALRAGALTFAVQPNTSLPEELRLHPRLHLASGLAEVSRRLGLPTRWPGTAR